MDNKKDQPGISVRKLEANRANAQKSTGPKTAEGKYHSSQNATKHALLSKELVIPGKEKREEFDQLLIELIKDFQPQSRAELSLVETIAINDWLLRRSLRAETAEIVGDPMMALNPVTASDRVLPNAGETSKILRYRTTSHRQKMQALQVLEELQQRRRNLPPTSADTESDAEEK